jgi:hypothetical protein
LGRLVLQLVLFSPLLGYFGFAHRGFAARSLPVPATAIEPRFLQTPPEAGQPGSVGLRRSIAY